MHFKSAFPRAAAGFCFAVALLAAQPYRLTPALEKSGPARAGRIGIPNLPPSVPHSLLFSIAPGAFGPDSRMRISLRHGDVELVRKTLHLGDPDLYCTFQIPKAGPAELLIEAAPGLAEPGAYRLQVNRWPQSAPLEREPNNTWQDATPMALDAIVFGSADEAPYIPTPDLSPKEVLEGAAGEDWFRFDFRSTGPKLVFFQLELMERDNIPVDVAVFRVSGGKPVAYNDGEDPVTLPHEVQALPGNKFTTRVLRESGTYYVRVRANHPEYKLRTRVYDPPPYDDPRTAVRTAVDYILGAGDSWHANTPRRGGVFNRVASVHQETSLCVACHPTHFSQRAQLYAAQNGYEVRQREQLQFLAERFYNNPRPFYGFEKEGAVWSRVISAPANVLSRMAVLLDLFEREVSGERREWYHRGVSEYLKLYYRDRDLLPPDETNGNSPLVSAYEVAWYSWRVTRDQRIARLVEQDEIKNLVDLCYQTLALADIDGVKHQARIRANAERILSLQRPDGQWAMRFEADQPAVEFQTGHALWALAAAGIPADHPQVARAIRFLLARQQPFGGWMDPLQSYENFRTPFRETQFAVVALSTYFPSNRSRRKGWNARVDRLSEDPAELLGQIDRLWDPPPAAVLEKLEQAAASNDALIRQQAVEALGRLGGAETLGAAIELLGDPSKLVQRTAARAVRQIYSRHENAPAEALLAALDSRDGRARWGATRVFATHFAALARSPKFAGALARRVADPIATIRMQAVKGLWQFWFWTPDEGARDRIEDTFLSAMARPQHPWVERNLREGIYNLADENIRYFYNNWVPLLARAEDRERAIHGRLALESRLARKFAETLERGSERQKRTLLAGLAELQLRRADVYDLAADQSRPAPAIYNRIGNDIEQSVFFGASADRFARALLPLLDSPDAETRRLASMAALLTRDITFPGVIQAAGRPGKDRDALLQVLAGRESEYPEVVKAMRPPAARSAARAATGPAAHRSRSAATRPDATFFRGYVQPILEKRGKDGYACVHCHSSHTLFNGSYATALNVVDVDHPENSLILRKPTSSAESEGTLGAKTLSHGGGVRWEKDSPEYQTILKWIRGAGQ